MTLPTKSLFTLLALSAGSSIGNALQSDLQMHEISGAKHINYDMATGAITPASGGEKAVTLLANFSNIDSSGFFSGGLLDSTQDGGPGGPEVWLDWGIVPSDTGSDIVGEFDFAYATIVTATNAVDLKVAFYDGVVGFCADTGLAGPSAAFTFSGLPGVTTSSSGSVTNAYIVTVNLDGGFSFCNAGVGNPFGFSIESFDDDGTGAWASGPVLCHAGDGAGGPDSNGQVPVFDIYDTAVGTSGICIGSFFFSSGTTDVSWFLEMRTAAPDVGGADDALVVQSNGSGINPNTFVVSKGLVLGESLIATDGQTTGSGVLIAGFLSPLVFNLGGLGELLVNAADPAGEVFGSVGASGPYLYVAGSASIVIPVPKDLGLCGLTVHSQTIEFGGGIKLHNANALTIGF